MINEQALPVRGSTVIAPYAQLRIIRTMDNQSKKGFEKYGRYLETFNGRDSIRDMWEELADLIHYAEALTQEYERMKIMLFSIYYDVDEARDYMDEKFEPEELRFLLGRR